MGPILARRDFGDRARGYAAQTLLEIEGEALCDCGAVELSAFSGP